MRPFRQQKQALPVDVQAEVRALNENLDSTTDQMRRDIYTQIWNRVSGGQQRVREAIEKLGGTVQAQIAVTNAIGAEIPADVVNQIALLPEVRWIGKTSEPISLLDYSVPTIKASSFWDDGYTGGVHDVAIVDTGVDPDHPYLPTVANGRLIQNDPASLVEPSDPHGTQVAGVVASTLSNREGVAFGLDKLFDTRVGSWSVIYAGMEWAASHPEAADVLNHSQALIVGVDTVGVRYRMNNGDPDHSDEGIDIDRLIDTYNVTVTQAAGNDGLIIYTLVWPSDSYNAIVVAASDDQADTDRDNDDLMDDPAKIPRVVSSRGPTPGGRKKPDLTAPGEDILTTLLGGAWTEVSGTSFAAPHVAGAALLGRDFGLWHPHVVKAWLINSADDRGPEGWDDGWGWGYINLQTALNQAGYAEMDDNINPGQDKWYSGTMGAGEKATIAWLKHIGQSLADLNLYLYDSTGILIAESESPIDNVEQVVLNLGSNVPVYIKVAYVSVFGGQESYGLAVPSHFLPTSAPSWNNGLIATDTTWSVDQGFFGDMTVGSSATLTINFGVAVSFVPNSDGRSSGSDPTKSELVINGGLIADSAAFNSMDASSDSWVGIRILSQNGQRSTSLTDCIIRHASVGIDCRTPAADVTIENSTVEGGFYAQLGATGGDITVKGGTTVKLGGSGGSPSAPPARSYAHGGSGYGGSDFPLNGEEDLEPAAEQALTSVQLRPERTELHPNFPNPFNPETWLPYQLSEDAKVIIRIYNPTGRLVRRLDLGTQSAGYYTTREKAAHWDGKTESGEPAASGLYFYDIQAGDFSATRRMVILK